MEAREHLTLWTRPDSYMGPNWHDYYVVVAQHRDSDSVSRSNFIVAQRDLEAEADRLGDAMFDKDGDSFLQIVRDSHWAVGWVEFIYLHKDAPDSIVTMAGEMVCAIADYPVLDEEHMSELEFTEACEAWERMSVRDRVETIKDSRCGASIFAARRDELPQGDNGNLIERLRD